MKFKLVFVFLVFSILLTNCGGIVQYKYFSNDSVEYGKIWKDYRQKVKDTTFAPLAFIIDSNESCLIIEPDNELSKLAWIGPIVPLFPTFRDWNYSKNYEAYLSINIWKNKVDSLNVFALVDGEKYIGDRSYVRMMNKVNGDTKFYEEPTRTRHSKWKPENSCSSYERYWFPIRANDLEQFVIVITTYDKAEHSLELSKHNRSQYGIGF